MKDLLYIFPTRIKQAMEDSKDSCNIEEIRIVKGKPVIIRGQGHESLLKDETGIIFADSQDIEDILCVASEHSMYLKEDEINRGYITLKGGHRIGVCGTVSYLNGKVINHRDITSLNIRVAKEIIGCSQPLLSRIIKDKRAVSTLLISPPKRGKTTLLRDLSRVLSDEYKLRIAVVDERNELFGASSYDLGMRTDVLCGCKKSDGIMMMIRTMAPDVIIVDELGDEDDVKSIKKALTCGVCVIASLHGSTFKDVETKNLDKLFAKYVFIKDFSKFEIYEGVGAI